MLKEIFNGIKFGEIALIEYDSNTTPVYVLHSLLSWSEEKGYKIVIFDVFDSLIVYRKMAELLGFDTSLCKKAKVVKVGGRVNEGNVVMKLTVTEYGPFEKVLEEAIEQVYEDKTIVIPLGTEKVLSLYPFREQLSFTNFLALRVGDKRKKAFHFINTDLVKAVAPQILPMLEESFTTVMRLKKYGKVEKLIVVKSLNPKLDGLEVLAKS
ncbi:DUF257 family protein [Pyrococcus abyssi]|uniref:KaiC-like domain-containing protein n=1 Tax=Pyrococcus abyssi (strain GE5 / Orsay) TaxID=272844 RepID=Q9UZA9_PYRAB|nr:DUF257 family protein [Pyrococcus abyssi]CAB50150.1 Hypothetical protein PAB1558 [Pyrococcus abyssi GE5]CCE70680.1 TPA: hypothetical protein PAB1558 [Pyrococcus abyssi GE5]